MGSSRRRLAISPVAGHIDDESLPRWPHGSFAFASTDCVRSRHAQPARAVALRLSICISTSWSRQGRPSGRSLHVVREGANPPGTASSHATAQREQQNVSWSPAWSHDGHWLGGLVRRSEDGSRAIARMAVEPGRAWETSIPSTGDDAIVGDWTPDGKSLLLSLPDYRRQCPGRRAAGLARSRRARASLVHRR
jgi:hypothetical protein